MRPKKVILCAMGNDGDRSVLCFLLSTRGYRALSAPSREEAVALFFENQVNLVLADFNLQGSTGEDLIRDLKKISSATPMLLLGDLSGDAHALSAADAVISKKYCAPFDLLECIRTKVARKRGPKPGIAKPVVSERPVNLDARRMA